MRPENTKWIYRISIEFCALRATCGLRAAYSTRWISTLFFILFYFSNALLSSLTHWRTQNLILHEKVCCNTCRVDILLSDLITKSTRIYNENNRIKKKKIEFFLQVWIAPSKYNSLVRPLCLSSSHSPHLCALNSVQCIINFNIHDFYPLAFVAFSHDQVVERAEKWKSHEATTLQTIYDNLLDEMKVPGVCAQSDRA